MGNQHGGVAQLGEHLPCKQGVMGSNPIISIVVGKPRQADTALLKLRSEDNPRPQRKKSKQASQTGSGIHF